MYISYPAIEGDFFLPVCPEVKWTWGKESIMGCTHIHTFSRTVSNQRREAGAQKIPSGR